MYSVNSSQKSKLDYKSSEINTSHADLPDATRQTLNF